MSLFAALFALLYVGHLLSDYVVQTDAMASLKTAGATYPPGHLATDQPVPTLRSWLANQRHVASYSLTIAATVLLAGALGGFRDDLSALPPRTGPPTASSTAAGWCAGSMEETGSRTFHGNGGALHVDQTFHLLTLVLLAAFLGR
jgi:hypothetical protein